MMDHTGIEIRIEVLSVEGVAGADTPRLQQDVARELTRLVEDRGLLSGGMSSISLGLVSVDLPPSHDAVQSLAYRVADAVYGVLAR